jgi:hypothetical protein
MRGVTWIGVVGGVMLASAVSSWAQDTVTREEFEKLKKELEALKTATRPAGHAEAPQEQEETSIWRRLGFFSKRVTLGGYMDLEFTNREKSDQDTFDAHRFVPFIYADISDHVKIASEVEIEHGNELGIEFATIEYWAQDWLNLRAGIILLPLGQFNLLHDAPYQDLAARPLVDTWVVPAVLRDPGVGIFGRIDADPWVFDYEIAVTNGFKGLDDAGADPEIDQLTGLRDARPHDNKVAGTSKFRDFNDNKALTGRLAVSPFLGLEVGVSGHLGKYDQRGEGDLTIWAVDGTVRGGGLYNQIFGAGGGILRDLFFASEFVFEYASADVERTPVTPVSVPEELSGFYWEYRYHFFFDFLRSLPGMTDESTFTAVFRFDNVDLGGFVTRRRTAGLNLRLTEATVFKFEYHWTEEHADKPEVDDDDFMFSVATYF